jgi:hypothetical protein
VKITVTHLKARISTLGHRAGPIIALLGALVVGLFTPSAFENDYFILLILFFGILWVLIYGAGPLKTDAATTVSPKVSPAQAAAIFSRSKAAWKAAREKRLRR